MDDEIGKRIGPVVGQLVRQMMEIGLTWDEAACVFGLAAKTAAQFAASAGGMDIDECIVTARERFEEAFAQDVRVVVKTVEVGDSSAESDDNPLLATARRRQSGRLH
jgi:hypothetical protein